MAFPILFCMESSADVVNSAEAVRTCVHLIWMVYNYCPLSLWCLVTAAVLCPTMFGCSVLDFTTLA